MPKPARLAHRPRSYESPLREEQAGRVRSAILDAAIALVAIDGRGELTLRKVALRAGVSVPTVYRNFPSVEALSQALFDHINALFGFPDMPRDLAGVLALPRVLYDGFERNDLLVRAYQHSPLRREHQKKRYPLIRKAVAGSLPELSAPAQTRLAALAQLFLSGQTWFSLHDHWGLNGREAGELAQWALRVLIDAARKAPHKVPGAEPPKES